jgi:hypothetical protein
MSASRYIAPANQPKPVSDLSRAQLCARVTILRSVLDTLWEQTVVDGAEPFDTIGRAKVELIRLENDLRERDRAAAAVPFAAAVTQSVTTDRLQAAQDRLDQVRKGVA